jgi:murein DD-endopeptidase MepM/ murein hydrolase activator NlpD
MYQPPYVFDFTKNNPRVTGKVEAGGAYFQEVTDADLESHKATWGIGRYLERRDGVLAGTYIAEQGRLYHLGVDIAFPKDTPLFAPLDGEIFHTGFADTWGDYGYYSSTKHQWEDITFYLFYGHLKKDSFKASGRVKAGEQLALLGDFEENGQWFHHTHLQICLLPWEVNTTPDGYCSEANLDQYRLLNPNPLLMIKEFLPSILAAN